MGSKINSKIVENTNKDESENENENENQQWEFLHFFVVCEFQLQYYFITQQPWKYCVSTLWNMMAVMNVRTCISR